MPKVVIKVGPDGSTKIDFVGYEGQSCIAADDKLRELLATLGVQVEETSFVGKPELHAVEEIQTQQTREGQK
jgi:hypothetical protein